MPQVDEIAAKVGDLPALPEVITRVMSLIYSPKTTIKDLEKVIAKDQALAAKVLRIANSAFYGARREVNTLSRAIVILGFNTLRSLVLTGASETIYGNKNSNFKERILWEHSVAVALAARIIARECNYEGPEEAYVGGLLHDIGKVVLDVNFPEDYRTVIQHVYNQQQTFVEAEREVFGFDHAEVGALVVRQWSFDPKLQEAVRLHHDPMAAKEDPLLCAIISLANDLCAKLGIGPERRSDIDLSRLDTTLRLKLDAGRLEPVAGEIVAALEREKELLSVA